MSEIDAAHFKVSDVYMSCHAVISSDELFSVYVDVINLMILQRKNKTLDHKLSQMT